MTLRPAVFPIFRGAPFYGLPGSISFLPHSRRERAHHGLRPMRARTSAEQWFHKGGSMKHKSILSLGVFLLAALVLLGESSLFAGEGSERSKDDKKVDDQAQATIDLGRQIFRFDTFGDEAWWGDTLKLHQAIAGARNGGVGPGVSPKTALAVGLKVDADALPGQLKSQIRAGRVNLDDPATTLALLKLNAVVGVTGIFDGAGNIKSMGVQCALCHSTVDDSFAPGIGKRLDGWANRDLNVGLIVSLAPNLTP